MKINSMINQIYPFSWFEGKAKAKADFYCSVFPYSRKTSDMPWL